MVFLTWCNFIANAAVEACMLMRLVFHVLYNMHGYGLVANASCVLVQVLRHLLPAPCVSEQNDPDASGADDWWLLGHPHLHLLPTYHAGLEQHRHQPPGTYPPETAPEPEDKKPLDQKKKTPKKPQKTEPKMFDINTKKQSVST